MAFGFYSKISAKKPTPQNANITLLAAGDFIAHDSINMAAKQPDGGYNYLPLMDTFTPILTSTTLGFVATAS